MQLLPSSNSQCGQESFVVSVLNGKRNGHFLEIGAWDYKDTNNTYLLETDFEWQGIAVEISNKYARRYNKNRRNHCINSDALSINYSEVLANSEFPNIIDYLQLDIDPAVNTFNCLLKIPFDQYQFRVVTFEHDLYVSPQNKIYQKLGNDYLESLGYQRIARDVCYNGLAFEDWYVKPNLLPGESLVELKDNVNWQEHFE
jgi:hypothetical protein